jgi:hypothetical protein
MGSVVINTSDLALYGQLAAQAWAAPAAAVLTDQAARSLTGGAGLEKSIRWAGPDGELIYPVFQFVFGAVHPAITRSTEIFVRIFDDMGCKPPLALLACWLTTDYIRWPGSTALEFLRVGQETEVESMISRRALALFRPL